MSADSSFTLDSISDKFAACSSSLLSLSLSCAFSLCISAS